MHNLVSLPLLSYRNSGTGAWSRELGIGTSAVEVMCILEGVLEALLPLLWVGGSWGMATSSAGALAGLPWVMGSASRLLA